MPETTTEQTPQQQDQGQATASQTQQEGQVQQTVDGQQGQPQGPEPVDLSKVPADQLNAEQIKELQQGYLRQSDYTKKTTDLAAEREKLTDYDALIQRPDFIQWAANKQAQMQPQEKTEEDISQMNEEEKVAYLVKKQMAPIAQSYYQDKQRMEDKELTTKYGESYSTCVPKITQMQQAIARQPYIYREEAFKILDYETAQKRAFEAGRQEGLKGIQQRANANIAQQPSSPPTTQREVFRGKDALTKIWERAEKEGRTA